MRLEVHMKRNLASKMGLYNRPKRWMDGIECIAQNLFLGRQSAFGSTDETVNEKAGTGGKSSKGDPGAEQKFCGGDRHFQCRTAMRSDQDKARSMT